MIGVLSFRDICCETTVRETPQELSANSSLSSHSVFPDSTLTFLMANAGVGGPTSTLSDEGWERILGVNMYGVINVCQSFAPEMKHSQPSLIVNTGSKQGITTPPGSGPAYNVSKAAVKVYTEQLAHELRQNKDCKTDVSLLIPGWVHTGLTGAKSGKPKPDGAWTPEQVSGSARERGESCLPL